MKSRQGRHVFARAVGPDRYGAKLNRLVQFVKDNFSGRYVKSHKTGRILLQSRCSALDPAAKQFLLPSALRKSQAAAVLVFGGRLVEDQALFG